LLDSFRATPCFTSGAKHSRRPLLSADSAGHHAETQSHIQCLCPEARSARIWQHCTAAVEGHKGCLQRVVRCETPRAARVCACAAFIGWAGGRGICPPNLQFTPGSRIAGESQSAAGSPLGQPGRAPLGLRPRCVRCAMRGAGPQRSADVPHGVAPGLRREGTAAQSLTPSQAAPWPASPRPAPPACLWL
jgi:hypothetical protein